MAKSALAIVLIFGLALGSCSPFAGFVSDHWPRWAGGEPKDVPPRPGAPGYEEYIAHRQPAADATTPGVANQKPADAKAQAAPAGNGPPSGANVGQGGLY